MTLRHLLLGACFALPFQATAQTELRVYAAASLTDALREVSSAFTAAAGPRVRLVFAASSTLARQIEAGAHADLFVSADHAWMDYLAERGRLQAGTRIDLIGNRLSLVAPADRGFEVRFDRGFDLAAAFRGRLCTGEPGRVPAGTYARQALQALGWWDGLRGRIVGTDDVRSALALLERGECALGVVYGTDAAASRRIARLGDFPSPTHAPIVYPAALVDGASPRADALLAHLQGAAALAVFRRHGFQALPAAPP